MSHSRQHGLTLIELMITLSIVAILVALAGPPYRQFIQNQRLSAAASDLQAALSYARAEAIKRSARVVVCASSAANAAAPNCTMSAAGPDTDGRAWSAGWIVFVDYDNDLKVSATAAGGFPADIVLRVQQGPLQGIRSASFIAPSESLGGFVSYGGSGFSRPIAPTKVDELREGRILLCDNRDKTGQNNFARAVWVMGAGLPRIDAAAEGENCP